MLLRPVAAGDALQIQGQTVLCPQALGIGHKVAACHIAAGDKIIKYGAPIGSARRDIRPGEHVHLHNIRSDYISTYVPDSGTGG